MRRGISAKNTPNAKIMAPVANMLSHFNSAWAAITLLRGIDISASKPNFSDFRLAVKTAHVDLRPRAGTADHGAVRGGDARISAERIALAGHLRQEQKCRHQRRNCIGADADKTTQTHHDIAALKPDDFDRIAVSAKQRFRRDQLAVAQRQAEIGAQRLPVGTDNGDFLDRRGVEVGLPHSLDVTRLAAIDAALREVVERADHLRDAEFGERDGALGGGVDFLLALPVDQAAEPKIEREHGRAGDKHADENRKNILAREFAHNQTHPGVRQTDPILVSGQ